MYTMIGRLINGEKIFMDESGSCCIEREYTYLVEATTKELEEIFRKFPNLKPQG